MDTKDKNKKFAETLALGLYNLAVREGPIEDFHAENRPIGQKEMEVINRFAYNRLAYVFNLLYNGERETFEKLCLQDSVPLAMHFDAPDYESKEVIGLKEILEGFDFMAGWIKIDKPK
jgi:hypothetical protein